MAAITRNEILPFAMMWMELEGIMLSEISQSEKELSYDLSGMRNLRGRVGIMERREGKMKQNGTGEGNKP